MWAALPASPISSPHGAGRAPQKGKAAALLPSTSVQHHPLLARASPSESEGREFDSLQKQPRLRGEMAITPGYEPGVPSSILGEVTHTHTHYFFVLVLVLVKIACAGALLRFACTSRLWRGTVVRVAACAPPLHSSMVSPLETKVSSLWHEFSHEVHARF